MLRTTNIHLPGRGNKMNSLRRTITGNGTGSVLLDGGTGGQSSYHSLDDYYNTANKSTAPSGRGLSDKIGERLAKLKINNNGKPRIKNIVI